MASSSHFAKGEYFSQYGRNIAANTKFELDGDWVTASRVINNLAPTIRKSVLKAQLIFANRYLKALKRTIDTSGASIKWPPLSPTYALKKGSKPIGFYTGTVYRALSVIQHPAGFSVGIPKSKDISPEAEGLKPSQYLHIFEVGSRSSGIKARPLFGPVFRNMGGQRGIQLELQKQLTIDIMRLHNISV